jgi:hypothetical protein
VPLETLMRVSSGTFFAIGREKGLEVSAFIDFFTHTIFPAAVRLQCKSASAEC